MSANNNSLFRKITKSSSMNEYLCSIFPLVDFKRLSLLSYFFTCAQTYDRYQDFSLSTGDVWWTIVWKWHDLILPLHFVYSLDTAKEVSLKVNSYLGWTVNWKCCKTLRTFGNIFWNKSVLIHFDMSFWLFTFVDLYTVSHWMDYCGNNLARTVTFYQLKWQSQER